MSIIAVSKFPFKWSKLSVMKLLVRAIKGQFEALNFEVPRGSRDGKICYLRLSERLDPVHVVEKINRTVFVKIGKLRAYIPRRVPDIALNAKPTTIPLQQRKRLKIPLIDKPLEIFITTHIELMAELQSKYTGLYNLSGKTDHKLLAEIAQILFERLKIIMDTNSEVNDCVKLSKCYRLLYPHSGDFQLILSTLHKIQDTEGVARDQVVESELAAVNAHPFVIDNISGEKVKEVCNKYSEKIIRKVDEYINSYDCEIKDTDSEEEIDRKRVRKEFKKISSYMPLIIKQVINKYLMPHKSPFHRVRVYGDPFLPSKAQMLPITRKFRATKVMRSDRMYNMLKFNIPPEQYTSLMTMDGTVIDGAKLVIRSSDIPLYKIPETLRDKMRAAIGATTQATDIDYDMPVDANDVENWDEDIML